MFRWRSTARAPRGLPPCVASVWICGAWDVGDLATVPAIAQLAGDGLREMPWQELAVVAHWRRFPDAPDKYLGALPDDRYIL
jgi:hypothetical protein